MSATRPSIDEASRYTRRSILRSERVYGRGFQSPGGVAAIETLCRGVPMRSGMRVLDIGSGLGGAAFHFARRHGASVVGVDAAAAMIELANERAREEGVPGVEFVHGDVASVPLEPASFDLVWTRDAMLYVGDKGSAWAKAYACLRPGGHLVVTDFCRGEGRFSAELRRYCSDHRYFLDTIEAYVGALAAAGFRGIEARNLTPTVAEALVKEREHLRASRAEFLRDFQEDEHRHLLERWARKIELCYRGELVWGAFVAHRPLA